MHEASCLASSAVQQPLSSVFIWLHRSRDHEVSWKVFVRRVAQAIVIYGGIRWDRLNLGLKFRFRVLDLGLRLKGADLSDIPRGSVGFDFRFACMCSSSPSASTFLFERCAERFEYTTGTMGRQKWSNAALHNWFRVFRRLSVYACKSRCCGCYGPFACRQHMF